MSDNKASAHDQIENKKISDRSITVSMLACVFGILIMASLLVTTTWAWFTGSVGSSENSIESAYCTVESVIDENGAEVEFTPLSSGKVYSLSGGVEYTFTMTVEGTASGGYCKLIVGEDGGVHYTQSIAPASSETDGKLSFTVTFDNDVTLTVKTGWGIHTKTAEFTSGRSYVYTTDSDSFSEN